MESHSISQQQKQNKECGSIGSNYLLGSLWVWLSGYSMLSPNQLSHLSLHVRPVVQSGLVALTEFLSNKRHLIGLGLGVVGVASVFAYQLFPKKDNWDLDWYYRSYFFLFFTLRLWVALIFLSTAKFLCVPQKWKSHWVVYALTVSTGFGGVIHYLFFVHDEVSYHSFPAGYVVLIALGLGVGFIKAMDHLCYRKYHQKDGNTCRMVGVIEMEIPWTEKEKTLKLLAQEYRDYNARIPK